MVRHRQFSASIGEIVTKLPAKKWRYQKCTGVHPIKMTPAIVKLMSYAIYNSNSGMWSDHQKEAEQLTGRGVKVNSVVRRDVDVGISDPPTTVQAGALVA